MGVLGKLVWVGFAWVFGSAAWNIYSLVSPPECTEVPCIAPLFQPDQLVDVHVFTSTKKKAPMTGRAFGELVPLWNATELNSTADLNMNVNVSLPTSVRQNGTLYAHVYLVRAGLSPNPSDHRKRKYPKDQAWYHAHPDLVVTSMSLTRHMSPIARNASSLLSGEGGEGDADTNGEDNSTADVIDPEFEKKEQNVQPFLASIFLWTITSLMSPSAFSAVIRYGIMAVTSKLALPAYTDLNAYMSADDATIKDLVQKPSEPPITHWKGKMDIHMSVDTVTYGLDDGALPALFLEYDERRKTIVHRFHPLFQNETGLSYAPRVECNEMSLLERHLTRMSTNQSASDPTLNIRFRMVSRVRSQILAQFSSSMSMMSSFGLEERDFDDVKYLFSESSLFMLALTNVISILHLMFDYLAFKTDVGFFKNRNDYTGISGRSILSSFVCSSIILLFLLDNDYTSWLIVGSLFVSTAIEGWKVNRVLKPKLVWHMGLPWAETALTKKSDATSSKTDEVDAVGFYYLSLALYPLVAGWAVYSLVYQQHKSWWSWIINALANGVYTFGFIAMTPQLFVNYKFKSVAHLPWKVFMYKAFNTFIDDVFSFIVVMPMAHRIACLRDDLVFFIFLYQMYLYPIDKTRPNEYGIAYEQTDEEKKASEGKALEKAIKEETAAAATMQATLGITEEDARKQVASMANDGAAGAAGGAEKTKKKAPAAEGLRKRAK